MRFVGLHVGPALLALMLTCSAACTGSPRNRRSSPADTLVVAIPTAPLNLDPRIGTDKASYDFHRLLFSGLLQRDRRDRLVPDLAASWSRVSDRAFRFRLRPGIRFHDGRPLRARDVAYTFRSIMNGTIPTAKAGSFRDIQRINVLNDRELVFVLRRPNSSFLINLTLGIVPEGWTGKGPPVGTGPFRWGGAKAGRWYELIRYDGYHGPRPAYRRLVLRVIPDVTVRWLELRRGSVDMVISGWSPGVLDRARSEPHLRVLARPSSDIAYLTFNLRRPILRDPRVRRALAYALNRDEVIRFLFAGAARPAESLLYPEHWAFHRPPVPRAYQPDRARRLLDEAGYRDPDGPGPRPRFTLTLKTSTHPFRLEIAQVLQAQLRRVGVRLRIRSLEWGTFYYDITHRNFDLFAIVRVGISDPDIFTLVFHSRSQPPAGANRGDYQNPEIDRLLDRAREVYEPDRRRILYARVQEILYNDAPCVYLWYEPNIAVMQKEVKGFEFYPNGDYYSLVFVRK